MADYGKPIPTDQAWRTFGDWQIHELEVGAIFFGNSGSSLYTMGFVESARNGKIPAEERRGESIVQSEAGDVRLWTDSKPG